MYVCICNAVTEDDVRGCMAHGGCRTAKEVKAACGMSPGCGSCTRRLHAMVSEYRTASELVDALTGGPASLELAPAAPDLEDVPMGDGLEDVPAGASLPTGVERGAAPPTAA
ncbi:MULTISPECIES: (2Fe-2S)-binding protein [Actinomadura]|uniref:Bacterioferritin-associated ferredoxin n=1 Tax=Actinomadura yumaensis TaxID=111807 RepID=A0ABW2D250_9ACTN|nr:(2Fe-2S)-binding protein [Actinomadura sp. J1-007]MWK36092.1 hypothetical protein [Actinomadura sp. J1-007]